MSKISVFRFVGLFSSFCKHFSNELSEKRPFMTVIHVFMKFLVWISRDGSVRSGFVRLRSRISSARLIHHGLTTVTAGSSEMMAGIAQTTRCPIPEDRIHDIPWHDNHNLTYGVIRLRVKTTKQDGWNCTVSDLYSRTVRFEYWQGHDWGFQCYMSVLPHKLWDNTPN
jgi:hypothetical protein